MKRYRYISMTIGLLLLELAIGMSKSQAAAILPDEIYRQGDNPPASLIDPGDITIELQTINPGHISGDQEIRSGETASLIRNSESPELVGGKLPAIAWEFSYSKNGEWIPIENAKAVEYAPGILHQTTYFRRVTIQPSDGKTAVSNIVCIKVVPSSQLSLDANRCYILTKTPYVEKTVLDDLSVKQCKMNVQYFDGLGRTSETIDVGVTPDYYDQIVLSEYNDAGKEWRSWLPLTNIQPDHGSYLKPLIYLIRSESDYCDSRGYTEKIYEKNPLSREIATQGPGEEWIGKAGRTEYMTNIVETSHSNPDINLICNLYQVQSDKLINTGRYAKADLSVVRRTDEDGNRTYEFKDKAGRVILSRSMAGTIQYDTYYVYDDMSNLRYVLPPMASEALTDENVLWDESDPIINGYAYLYCYDQRQRCIRKKLPGADWLYNVYDKSDRLIFTQDGNMRAENPNRWIFTIPDAMGRTVLTGTCEQFDGSEISPGCLDQIIVTASYKTSPASFDYLGYELTDCSLGEVELLSVDYYDNYDYLASSVDMDFSGLEFAAVEGFDSNYTTYDPKGYMTGKVSFPLDDKIQPTCEAIYYDKYKRIAQSVMRNHLGGISRHLYKRDFVGNVLSERETHQAGPNADEDVLDRMYRYDHARRIIGDSTTLNGGTPAVVAYTYDDRGRRIAKQISEGLGEMAETYEYNIRGWLTRQHSPFFCQILHYQDAPAVDPSHTVCYSGNINSIEWQHSGSDRYAYLFGYDALHRLTQTDQYTNGTKDNQFIETNLQYDKNGNILQMERYTMGESQLLRYRYRNSNKLLSSLDLGGLQPDPFEPVGYNLSDNASLGTSSTFDTCTYDANGNRIFDVFQSMKVKYNLLNRPASYSNSDRVGIARKSPSIGLWVPGQLRASYSYTADGVLRQVTDNDGNGFDYLGSLVYIRQGDESILESAAFSEGRIEATSAGYKVNYFLTDHLGSVRCVVDNLKKRVEKNDYYPFGSRWTSMQIVANKGRYGYNGKESQETGNIGVLNYDARMYAPGTACWSVPDPMAEKYYSLSPYAFCGNNPIKYVDPKGTVITDYFNLLGNLVYHVDDGNDAKYLVLTLSKNQSKIKEMIAAGAALGVPSNKVMESMNGVYENMDKESLEYGFRVGENGTVSRLVKGQTQEIDAQDWKPAVDDLKAAGDKVAYNVHGHPLYRDKQGKVVGNSDYKPSVTDRKNAVGTQPNIVLGYDVKNSPSTPGSLSSEISKEYIKTIEFYNKQNYPFKSFRFSTFESAVMKINNR